MKFEEAEEIMQVAVGVKNLSFFRSYTRLLNEALEALDREACAYTHPHTRDFCGHPDCREQ